VISIEPTEGLQALAEIAARCSIVTRHQSEIESSIRRKIGAASSENLVLIPKTEFSIRTGGRLLGEGRRQWDRSAGEHDGERKNPFGYILSFPNFFSAETVRERL